MSSLIFARQYGFGCRIDDHNCSLSEVKCSFSPTVFLKITLIFHLMFTFIFSLQLCVTGEMVMWFLETYVINKEVISFFLNKQTFWKFYTTIRKNMLFEKLSGSIRNCHVWFFSLNIATVCIVLSVVYHKVTTLQHAYVIFIQVQQIAKGILR